MKNKEKINKCKEFAEQLSEIQDKMDNVPDDGQPVDQIITKAYYKIEDVIEILKRAK